MLAVLTNYFVGTPRVYSRSAESVNRIELRALGLSRSSIGAINRFPL
jgi:hypothetical protein